MIVGGGLKLSLNHLVPPALGSVLKSVCVCVCVCVQPSATNVIRYALQQYSTVLQSGNAEMILRGNS